ncbi:MAG: ABC transporter permease [Planctomycetota bacterium]
MSAFLALVADVPRRMRTSWISWILIVIMLGLLALFVAPLGVKTDSAGEAFLTYFANDTRPPPNSGIAALSMHESLEQYIGQFFGLAIASYCGVFAGLIFLSDAVTSAFAPGQAELNLPKPVHRATIVLARHVGALVVATFFAVLLIGSAVGLAFLRTGIVVWKPFVFVPASVAMFGMLHAFGTIAGVGIQNALLAAFASVGVWLLSIVTKLPEWIPMLDKIQYPLLQWVVKGVRIGHRVLPRPIDVPPLAARILEKKFAEGGDFTTASELELIGNTLGWWALGLVLAVLVVRKRDF